MSMSTASFDTSLENLCSDSCTQDEVVESAALLHAFVATSEIRDFDWVTAGGSSLYLGVYKQLKRVWLSKSAFSTSQTESEEALLQIWNYVVTLPEFDHSYASSLDILSETFTTAMLLRLVGITTSASFATCTHSKGVVVHIKRIIHWLYKENVSQRKFIRTSLGKLVLQTADQIDFGSGSTSTAPVDKKVKAAGSVDARDTRGHVTHCLDLLHCIIAGLDIADGEAAHLTFGRLLHDVLLPLHKPNSMVLWRDQVPVLQLYHEPLVRCMLALVERDSLVRSGHPIETGTLSILVQAVQGILASWPDKYETNTPKQVLLLHELEILLNKASQDEFALVKSAFLNRVVSCIGTDADNIRPAQRALQLFKNQAFLALLMGTGPTTGSQGSTADSKDAPDDCIERAKQAGAESLRMLLPALFRGGQLCWNPTVNKMTGLALNNLKSANEDVFASTSDLLFGSGGMRASQGKSFKASSPPSEKAQQTPLLLSNPPLSFADAKTSHQDAKDASKATTRGPNPDPVLWAMENMNLDSTSSGASAKSDTKSDSKGEDLVPVPAGKAAFPLPTGRPGRPPVSINSNGAPPVRVSGATGPSSLQAGGAVTGMMRPFDKSNPPPVTITGVAPWAMLNNTSTGASTTGNSSLGAVGSTAMGYSTTTMPGNRVPPRPFNPAAGRAGAPPNALSCTIQEARQARMLAEAKAHETKGDPSADTITEAGGDGLARILNFIQRCLPDTAPRTAEEEEAARQQDWRTVQAAVSPSLLPELRFHDLVFGAVLGEGAFSVVKYARQIVKDKTQSSWPEYAVKIIQASKIAALSYRTSVIREMAVLQLLSHPGVARLVSAFRYSDSAYMVLEYAARGDLHSYLIKHGKLEHKFCRFVVGEVVAAVNSLHESGFCYGDLKPENVLITELGHIKITDFGGCRSVTEEAAQLLRSSEHVLETIRNGDWKEESAAEAAQRKQTFVGTNDSKGETGSKENDPENSAAADRLEGTPAYLPPEILTKRVRLPGFAADAWALGCVTYFCLHGRPKFFGDNDQVLSQIREAEEDAPAHHHMVTFQEEEGKDEDVQGGFQTDWEDSAANDFISKLHNSDHLARMTIHDCLSDPYLTEGVSALHVEEVRRLRATSSTSSSAASMGACPAAMAPLGLHAQPPLVLPAENVRDGADLVDQQWSRRQFSVLWAPMPAEYQLDGNAAPKTGGGGSEANAASVWLMTHSYKLVPIEETDVERNAPFL